jgi:selenocysteine lyase/cysteine desulfurase
MDAAALRASIPVAERCTYLNTGSTGPSPRPVVEAVTDFERRFRFELPCRRNPYRVAEDAKDSARATVADHLGAAPGEIALTRSTTEGIANVAAAIDWEPGDVVVRTDLEHSAGRLPWARLADTHGVDVRVLETENGRLDLDRLADAVADARLLCLSSLTWNYGTRMRVAEAVGIAHDAGARVLVDAVQAPGQLPVDVGSWGADFVAGSGHKWLLGPWGAGFLYVDADAVESLEPVRIGGAGTVDAEDAAYELAPDATRFELGTTAIAPYVGLERAIETMESVGLDAIESRIADLAARLADGLGDLYIGPTPPESGLISFEADEPETAVDRLADDGIRIRSLPHPKVCRASVHAFNTADEVDALLDAL